MSGQAGELAACRVLVTRPSHQAADFIQLLKSRGADVLAFPTLKIEAIKNSAFDEVKLDSTDAVIFTSANAVRISEAWIKANQKQLATLELGMAAVGKATANALQHYGVKVNMMPESGFNSEALLAMDVYSAQKIRGRQVLLIKGEGGRGLLEQELVSRGAGVNSMDVYRRTRPGKEANEMCRELSENWTARDISAITVTSNESLQNLYDMLKAPGQVQMLEVPLIVPSERCLALAHSLGFKLVYNAASAHDSDMLKTLTDYCQTDKDKNKANE